MAVPKDTPPAVVAISENIPRFLEVLEAQF